MWIEGVVLESPPDMSAAWPEVWSTAKAAESWLGRQRARAVSTPSDPYIDSLLLGLCGSARSFRYQRSGKGQKWRRGAYDPAVVRAARVWLEARLGPLAGLDPLPVIPEIVCFDPKAEPKPFWPTAFLMAAE